MAEDQTEVGIVGYGVAIPKEKLDTSLLVGLRESRRKDLIQFQEKIKFGLGLNQKSVPGPDEDTITYATEAALNAINMSNVNPENIQAVVAGSESKPYAVGQIAMHAAAFLGIGNRIITSDMEGACNPAMVGIDFVRSKVKARDIDFGLAIGSDVSQAPQGDPLEYAAGAGAAAYVIGRENLVAAIIDAAPFSSLTLDFWRREGQPVPSHFGRTTEDAYLQHVNGSINALLERHDELTLSYFDYIITHQPSVYIPRKAIGIITGNYSKSRAEDVLKDKRFLDRKKLEPDEYKDKFAQWVTTTASEIGNTYAASTPMTLARVLDDAKPGAKILAVSYGSGAYSLATWLIVKGGIEAKRGKVPSFQSYMNRRISIGIGDYLLREKAKRPLRIEFPRFVGVIEPVSEFEENIRESFCDDCERIYYPARERCLDPECEVELGQKDLPIVGKVTSIRKLPKLDRMYVYKSLASNEVPIVSYKDGDVLPGTEVEAKVSRLYSKNRRDIINYGIAYRGRFRTTFPEKNFIQKLYQPTISLDKSIVSIPQIRQN